jgi:hypothetical protein
LLTELLSSAVHRTGIIQDLLLPNSGGLLDQFLASAALRTVGPGLVASEQRRFTSAALKTGTVCPGLAASE